ncbi:DUF3667 domain-containing protein [Ekhidna sp.]|uniref:DUF3667 domain-containing protein n=1 Tax=Ekhidna sp. TaxID=2608089 RepID=UPI003297345B
MTESNQPVCLNCGSKTAENYCINCGQSTSVGRITFRETINDFFSSTFALEGPLFSTIRLLIVNPGKLFREFISGRRKNYYKPVAFFVVLTAVYLILREASGYDPFYGQTQMKRENIPERAVLFVAASKFMVANINNILFFLVFSIGLTQKLFFYKKYNLAEYLVVGFFISGIYLLIGMAHILFTVFVIYVNPQINMLLLFLLILYASISFHRNMTFSSAIKHILASLMAVILYVILGYGFSVLMVYFGLG